MLTMRFLCATNVAVQQNAHAWHTDAHSPSLTQGDVGALPTLTPSNDDDRTDDGDGQVLQLRTLNGYQGFLLSFGIVFASMDIVKRLSTKFKSPERSE